MHEEQEVHVGEKRHASPGAPAMAAATAPAQPADDSGVDYRALYFQEAEKNKQLLQWIVQLQSNLSMRLQMNETRSANGDMVQAALCAGKAEHLAVAANSSSSETIKNSTRAADNRAAGMERETEGRNAPHRQSGERQSAELPRTSPEHQSKAQNSERSAGVAGQASAPSVQDAEPSGADLPRLTSRTVSSSKSSSASPSLSHRGSALQASGQENTMTPEMAHIDLARTTCNKCGQGFAFCAAFLSRLDFLVLPCPKCRAVAAIPPTPLAPTPSASGTKPTWQDHRCSSREELS